MSDKPIVAGTEPKSVMLEEGQNYAFCTCGRSSEQPFCDGAHKGTTFKPHVFNAEKSGEVWFCMCKQTCNTPYCDGTHKSIT